jgi:hypothetical protein
MKPVKTTNITIRIDDELDARVVAMEKATPVRRAEIIRQLLDAACRYFEEHGQIVFPVEISDGSNPPKPREMEIDEEMLQRVVGRYLREQEKSNAFEETVNRTKALLEEGSSRLIKNLDKLVETYSPETLVQTGEAIPILSTKHKGITIRVSMLAVEGVAWSTPDDFSEFRAKFPSFIPLLHDVTMDFDFPVKIYRIEGQGVRNRFAYNDFVVTRPWSFIDLPEEGSIVLCQKSARTVFGVLTFRDAREGERSDSRGKVPILKISGHPFEIPVTASEITGVIIERISDIALLDPRLRLASENPFLERVPTPRAKPLVRIPVANPDNDEAT